MIEIGGMAIDFGAINWFAVVVSVIFAMAFGATYYMPQVAGRPWMDALGTTVEEISARGGQMRAFAIAFVGAALTVIVLAIIIQLADAYSIIGGLVIGAMVSIGLVLAPMATTYIFEARPMKLFVVNAVENSISVTAISLILALWQ